MTSTQTIDFEKMAAGYDRFLHLIAPVGEAVLAEIPALSPGATVVDVACGTGEPGLTLAKRRPDARVVGVDVAPAMIEIARSKARRDGLANIRFEVMKAESLGFEDGSVGALTSRFGMLMFGDRQAQANELARVLERGGRFSVALWDGMKDNTFVRGTVGALRPHLPSEFFAPFDTFPGAISEDELRGAGLRRVETRAFRWSYEFPSEEALWQFIVGGGMFEKHFGQLGDRAKEESRASLLASFAPHANDRGAYSIPHACKLYVGER